MLIFDLDGTLIDSNNIWNEIDIQFFKDRNLTLTKDYTEFVTHTSYPEAAKYTKEKYNLSENADEIMQIWSDMAEKAYSNDISLKPGVKEFITKQYTAGVKLSIATSCMRHLCTATLRKNDILQYFSSITTVKELNVKNKSNPEFWILCAQKENVPASECTVFEDSIKGAIGAKDAGMHVIAVYDDFMKNDWIELKQIADKSIQSFTELKDFNIH